MVSRCGESGAHRAVAPDAAALEGGAAAWFGEHEDEFVGTVERLVRIPSVSGPFRPKCAHPFGKECARAIDEAISIGEGFGFECANHDYYAASIGWGSADARGTAAFYSHLDVVPAGEGWSFHPFRPFTEDGLIHGRGSNDNKGPACAVLFALRYLKESGYEPKCRWTVYLGANEEAEMRDVRYLVKNEPHPQVNLVSDAAFPVDYGEKGAAVGTLSVELDDPVLLGFSAGSASNAVAATAQAKLSGSFGVLAATGESRITASERNGTTVIDFQGTPAHAARPEGALCAIALAGRRLSSIDALSPRTRAAFAFLGKAFSEFDGSYLGIDAQDDEMGPLTCAGTLASFEDGVLRVSFDIRYPHSTNAKALKDALRFAARANGFRLERFSANRAFLRDRKSPLVETLAEIASEVKGRELEPYTMGGGTYARHIPGAVGFGACDLPFSSPLGPGRGGAHEPDEVCEVKMLREAFVIYVKAILAIDNDPALRR